LAAVLPGRVAFGDSHVAVATLAAAALVAQQVVGKALRDTLFLDAFGVTRLPFAMIASAVLSGALVLALSRASVARSPRLVAQGTFLSSASLFLAAWVLSETSPRAAAAVTYLHAGALGAASISVFWSLVSESFDPYSARRAIPRVMAGATLGGVIGGLTTWRAASWIAPADLLPVGAALNLVTLAAVSRLGRVAPAPSTAEATGESWRARIQQLPQLRFLALLVLAGALTQAILDYLLASAAVVSLGSGARLLSFFALFQTAIGVLSFLIQVGVSRSALERFGIGSALAVSPSLLIAGVIGATLLSPLTAAVVLRGTDGVLGASLHRSAYEVLFAPVEVTRRRASKPLLDVGFDRIGMLLGSAFVALIAALAPLQAHTVLLASVLLLAFLRLLLAPLLQAGYRGTLAETLRDGRFGATGVGVSGVGALDATSAAVPLLALGDPTNPRVGPPAAASPPDEDVVAVLRELRSGDPRRTLSILRRRHSEPLVARQVIALLGDDRVARDAADWITAQDPPPTGLLGDALLDAGLPDAARRRVARLLGKIDDPRASHLLMAALEVVPTGVRGALATALRRTAEKTRLPREPLLAAARHLAEEPSRGEPQAELEEIFTLLAAAYPGEPLLRALRALGRDRSVRGTALEWLDVFLPHEVKVALWPRVVRRGERIAPTARDRDQLRSALRSGPLHAESESAEEDA
jgi:hypothetical protein